MHFDFVGVPEDVVLPVGVGLCPKVFGSPCRCVKLFSRASPVIHHLVETVTHTLKQGGLHFRLVNQYFDQSAVHLLDVLFIKHLYADVFLLLGFSGCSLKVTRPAPSSEGITVRSSIASNRGI